MSCKALWCLNSIYKYHLCKLHYIRKTKWKDINIPTIYDRRPSIIEWDIAKIPLWINAKDWYAIVDKSLSYLDKYNRSLSKRWYPACDSWRTMHKAIMWVVNKWYEVDHINGNKLDNRMVNLRVITHRENIANRTRNNKNNTSWYIWVRWRKDTHKWCANIKVNYKNISLWSFINIEDAISARKKAEERLTL